MTFSFSNLFTFIAIIFTILSSTLAIRPSITPEKLGNVSRIIGGDDATSEQGKYYVQLYLSFQKRKLRFTWWPPRFRWEYEENPSLCGGTVHNRRWIITAAHCVIPPSEHKLRASDSYVSYRSLQSLNGQKTTIADIYGHKDFINSAVFYRDIGLIFLAEDLNGYRRAPTISSRIVNPIIVGFGWTSTSGWRASDLQVGELDADLVQVQYDDSNDPSTKYYTSSGSPAPCHEDSGGPLMSIEGVAQKHIGIISRGTNAVICGSLSYYTAMSTHTSAVSQARNGNFADWIKTAEW